MLAAEENLALAGIYPSLAVKKATSTIVTNSVLAARELVGTTLAIDAIAIAKLASDC